MEKVEKFKEKMKKEKEGTLNLKGIQYKYFKGFLVKIIKGEVWVWTGDRWFNMVNSEELFKGGSVTDK